MPRDAIFFLPPPHTPHFGCGSRRRPTTIMAPLSFYDEVELEDMEYDENKQLFHYPCPCGDRFEISIAQLRAEEDVARCPSCTLLIRVIYDPLDFTDSDGANPPAVSPMVSAAA